MPLLKRQKFKRNPVPDGLSDDDEVFFCPQTKEIFTDYEQFYERAILLNSLVWSCSYTGRHQLTFDEAHELEEEAKASLNTFPEALQKPILFLVSRTHRVRIDDVVNDVWNFMKFRFFKGEIVDLSNTPGAKEVAKVTEVRYCPAILPDKSATQVVGDNDDSDVEVILPKAVKSPNRVNGSLAKSLENVAAELNDPPEFFKYTVETVGVNRRKITVNHDSLSRKKGLLVKPRLKLFIKNSCEFTNGVFKLKPRTTAEVSNVLIKDFFNGPVPKFERSAVVPRKAPAKKEEPPKEAAPPKQPKGKSSSKVDHFEEAIKSAVGEVKQQKNDQQSAKKAALIQKQIEEQKAAEKEAQRKELERQKEELKEWKKPRDDLLCDDLVPLPEFPVVKLPDGIPVSCYGDLFCVLEFFRSFGSHLKIEEEYPAGVTLTDLCKILLTTQVEGPLFGFLKLLCDVVFELQGAEDGDEADLSDKQENQQDYELEHKIYGPAIVEATRLHEDSRLIYGLSVRDLPIDAYTLSEVLRLHIMSAGYFTGLSTAKLRYQQRGGFRCWDDPGMVFRARETQILQKLETSTMFDLDAGERLKVIRLLMDQIITFSVYREAIDDALDRLRAAKAELRHLKFTESRQEREATAAKAKIDRRNVQQGKKENSPSTSAEIPSTTEEEEREKAKERSRILKLMAAERDRQRRVLTQRETKKDRQEEKSSLNDINFDILTVEEITEVRQMQKERFMVEETNLMGQIWDLHQTTGEVLLGKDRAHRKYWLFNTIPGVLVEEEMSAEYLGPCEVGGTPIAQKLQQLSNTNMPNGVGTNGTSKSVVDKTSRCKELLACTGVDDNCPVHTVGLKSNTWRWIDSAETLTKLTEVLNPRGFREMDLNTHISYFQQRINDCIYKCPLSKGIDVALGETDTEAAYKNFELALRDNLLYVEEKIFLGGLGNPHVTDREVWRSAIEHGRYVACSKEISIGDDLLYSEDEINSQTTVIQLAAAYLQVAQGIELKYMKHPFGDIPSESSEAKSTRSSHEDEDTDSQFERWQRSLMKVSNFAQIQLHISSFEQHVAWNKSLLNIKCRQCRKKGEVNTTVLCSGCDRAYHFACLKPPLKKAPDESWLCSDCRPKVKAKRPSTSKQKSAKKPKYEDDDGYSDDLEESEYEETCGECGETIEKKLLAACSTCIATYHCGCVGLKSKPRGQWRCEECSGRESRTSSEEGIPPSRAKRPRSRQNGLISDESGDDRVSREVVATKLAQCSELVDLLIHHASAWPFQTPVNRRRYPEYYEVIAEPRDLGMISKKLDKAQYRNAADVVDDLRLMFENCRIFNESDKMCDVYQEGEELEKYMNECLEKMKLLDASEMAVAPRPRKRIRIQIVSDSDDY